MKTVNFTSNDNFKEIYFNPNLVKDGAYNLCVKPHSDKFNNLSELNFNLILEFKNESSVQPYYITPITYSPNDFDCPVYVENKYNDGTAQLYKVIMVYSHPKNEVFEFAVKLDLHYMNVS